MLPIGTSLKLKTFPKATVLILALCILLYKLTPFGEPRFELFIETYGYGAGNWYNPVPMLSSMFLHADFFHLFFNMMFLFIFGPPLEERIGAPRYLVYYLLTGIAAGILQTLVSYAMHPGMHIPGIGASGAISGVMGMFLYRCHHAKLKMVVSPLFMPIRLDIPVIPLLLFWFARDVIFGLATLDAVGGVGHWAHAGGFMCGMLVGWSNDFINAAKVEQLRASVSRAEDEHHTWFAARKDLEKLWRLEPDDPQVNVDLARIYAQDKTKEIAARHYRHAVQLYFQKDPEAAAFVAVEYIEAIGKPISVGVNIKAANILIDACDYEHAFDLLEPFASDIKGKSRLHETALATLAMLARHIDSRNTENFRRVFEETYPRSSFARKVDEAFGKPPGEVYKCVMRRKTKPARPEEVSLAEARFSDVVAICGMVFGDPIFWIAMFAGFIIAGLAVILLGVPFPLFKVIGISFLFTLVYRVVLSGVLFDLRKSKKVAVQEFDLKQLTVRAERADQSERYEEAAKLYLMIAEQNRSDYEAHYKLARLYHHRLGRLPLARKYYRMVMHLVPEDHGYHADAKASIAEIVAQTEPSEASGGV